MAESHGEDWTIGRLLDWTTGYLREHGSESPRLDAEVLLASAMGCERIALYTRYGEAPSDPVRSAFRELVRNRAQGAPVAYLVGHKEFFSLDFDVGPGSGNLAIAAAHQHHGATLWAIDSSSAAIAVAERNANRHGLAERIHFLVGNLFDPLSPGTRVDCILSNPPYIATAELANLPVGVRDYEPHQALDAGPTGLEVVSRIVAQAGNFLNPGGQFIIEIGSPQELALRKLFENL